MPICSVKDAFLPEFLRPDSCAEPKPLASQTMVPGSVLELPASTPLERVSEGARRGIQGLLLIIGLAVGFRIVTFLR